MKLEMEFAEKVTTNLEDIEYAQRETSGIAVAQETYEEKKFQDVPTTVYEITNKNRYVIVISIQKEYFKD